MPSLGTNWPSLFASPGWDCLGSAGAHVGDSPYGLGHMDSVRVPSGTTPHDARQSLARILKWVGGSPGVACFLIHMGGAAFALGQGQRGRRLAINCSQEIASCRNWPGADRAIHIQAKAPWDVLTHNASDPFPISGRCPPPHAWALGYNTCNVSPTNLFDC